MSLAPAGTHQRRLGRRRGGWLAAALMALAVATHAAELPAAETNRIEYLIGAVASLPGAQFVRNGTTYDAQAAVDHLRLKLRMAGAHVKTAEDFIRYCATSSSVSGTPYLIRLHDGTLIPSAKFLSDKLKEYDARHPRGA